MAEDAEHIVEMVDLGNDVINQSELKKKIVDLCSDTSSTLDDIKKTLKDVLMMADINKMNEILTSGLEEAVKKRRRDVAKMIVETVYKRKEKDHKRKQNLRGSDSSLEESEQSEESSSEQSQDEEEVTPSHQDEESVATVDGSRDPEIANLFRYLVKEDTKTAMDCLDDCIKWSKDMKRIKFNYKYLEDREKRAHHVLKLIHDKDNSNLLLHPVVKSLINWKWMNYLFFVFIINTVVFFVFISLLTAFALVVPNPQLDVCTGNQNRSNEGEKVPCDLTNHQRRFLIFAQVFIIVCSILYLLLKFLELFIYFYNFSKDCRTSWSRLKKDFGKLISASFYLEIVMHIFAIMFAFVFPSNCFCPYRWQWQIGTLCVFFAWVVFILYLNGLPSTGIYIGILWKIIHRFLLVSIIAGLLVIAFGFAFYMAFHEPNLPDTPFENPFVTLVTMISFAISSPDLSVFRLANDETDIEKIPYPVLSYSIWIIFGVVMSVLFFNFLVGLAVDDVGKLKMKADVARMKLSIIQFQEFEQIILFFEKLFCTSRDFPLLAVFEKRVPRRLKSSQKCESIYVEVFAYWLGDDIRIIIKEAKEILSRQEEEEADDLPTLVFKLQKLMKQAESIFNGHRL